MAFLNTSFEYNGESSLEHNCMLVHVGEETITQALSSPKTLITDHVKFKKTFYYGADKNTYSLSMKIIKIDGDQEEFSNEERMDIMRWLLPDDNFHVFTSNDFAGIEFIIQFNKSQFVSYRMNVGYFELEAISNDPYPLSEMETLEYDLSDNIGTSIIEVPNNCNAYPYFVPNVLEFTLVGTGTSFSLKNLTNGGNILSFSGLSLLETVSISSTQEILSSTGNERISKFNFGFNALELSYGINRLEITGACTIRVKLQYPIQL